MTDVRQYSNGHGRPAAPAPGISPASDFVDALSEAVNKNPVSAALIGMGVLWMFMGGNNTTLFGDGGRRSLFGAAARSAGQVGGAIRDAAAAAGSSVNQAGHAAAETASQWARTPSTSNVAAETASRTADRAGGAIASAYGSTAQAASSAAGTISTTATSAAQAMRETGTRWGMAAQHSIADLFARQPLLLGAVGIAIGAGIAASIPTTETEKSIMGHASDSVRDTVTETTAEVKRMADAAVEEAENQGLTPEAAGEVLRSVGEKK